MEQALDEESEEYSTQKKHDSKGSRPIPPSKGGKSVQIVWRSEDVIGSQTNHYNTSMASETNNLNKINDRRLTTLESMPRISRDLIQLYYYQTEDNR